jgi:hypothetical protein
MSNFMKIPQLGAELLQAHGRTDLTKPIVSSRSFANAPKSGKARCTACCTEHRKVKLLSLRESNGRMGQFILRTGKKYLKVTYGLFQVG